MDDQQPDIDVLLYITDDFDEDKITDREFVVIQSHLSSLMLELLIQTSIDKEK